MKLYKKILLAIFICFAIFFFNKVYAAGVTINAKSQVVVGKSFTVTVTGTGAASYDVKVSVSGAGISDTIYLSAYTEDLSNGSKSVSKTYTAKQKGKISISVNSGSNCTVSGAKKSQPISGNGKTVEVIEDTSNTTKPQAPQTTQTTKPATTTKTTTTKTTTKKEETKKEPIEEVKEKEDASSEWGISSLKLVGVKENGEEIDLSLDKEFNIKTYEYSCTVENDIKTIKVFKEAYEYNELVQISGLDEELKVGENEIILKMAKEGKDALTYKIKVIKEEPQEEAQQTSSNVEEKEKLMVSMPVFWFVILEIAIVAVSVGTTVVVMRYLRKN